MTREQFDNYRFGVFTEVKFNGEWHYVKEIDFMDCYISIRFRGKMTDLDLKEVEDIRN